MGRVWGMYSFTILFVVCVGSQLCVWSRMEGVEYPSPVN